MLKQHNVLSEDEYMQACTKRCQKVNLNQFIFQREASECHNLMNWNSTDVLIIFISISYCNNHYKYV